MQIFPGHSTPVSFSAQVVADYEDEADDRVFLADFIGMVKRYEKTGFFKISFVARLCYLAVRAAYTEMGEPLPEGVTIKSILERMLADDGADLVAQVVVKMTQSLPQAKNADSPGEEQVATPDPKRGKG